jgi:hypothetical protein
MDLPGIVRRRLAAVHARPAARNGAVLLWKTGTISSLSDREQISQFIYNGGET